MDNVTHSLFALTLARTPLGRAGRGTTAALLLASNAPDIDVVAAAGGALGYLEWHRGPSHGPLGVIGLGLLTAGLVWGGRRLFHREPGGESFASLAGVSVLGVLLHVAMDFPTAYGTRLLSPFEWTWYAADWMPIIDIYLLAALAAGLLFGRPPAVRARNAAIVLALMGANYGLRATSHQRAIALAPEAFGGKLPARCEAAVPAGDLVERWPRDASGTARERAAGRCLVEVAAIPTFLSPFRWQLVAQLSNAYETTTFDLLDAGWQGSAGGEGSPRRGVRHSNQWTPAVIRAAETEVGRVFLGFARFPAASSSLEADGSRTVIWRDLRFIEGEGASAGARGEVRGGLFTAVVRIGADGSIVEQHLGR